jgi:hypothetical protein
MPLGHGTQRLAGLEGVRLENLEAATILRFERFQGSEIVKINSALFICCTVLAAPAFAAKPQIQWNESYPFESIETFQWQSTPDSSLAEREPFIHSRIVTTIEYHLTGSGLTRVESDPDIYITYHTSTDSNVRLRSNSYGYGFSGYGRGGWGYYGYGMTGPISTTTDVIEYVEGTLVVDIWDADSRELVWRGSVTRTLSDDISKVEKDIVKAIEAMAKQGRKLWERSRR